MRNRTIQKICAAGIISCLFFAAPVVAENATSLETLTVTARKKEENLQDVSISIELFTDMDMEDYGLDTMSDVILQSANVFMKSNAAEHPLIIRGISSFKSAIFSPAGFYIDDVSCPLSYMTNPDLLDIERIEILKGPQGTLYGRNTLSGLVNLVTKKPDNETRGKIRLEAAAYDSENNGMRYRAGASLSGPIQEDHLFMGVAVHRLFSDGFRTDIATGDDKTSDQQHLDARGTLRYTPSTNLDISLTAEGSTHDDGFGVYRLVSGPFATPSHTVNSGDPGLDKNETNNAQNLKIRWKTENWNLVSVTSRMDYDIDFISDMDFVGRPMFSGFGFDDLQYSQEVRIASEDNSSLNWLAGVYGFKEDTGTCLDIQRGSRHMWHPKGNIEMQGYALFSQLSWNWTSKWEIAAGLRWDHQELSGQVVNDTTAMMPFLPPFQSFAKDLSYDEILPKISLEYASAPWANLYASIAKGYQVGGYNYSMVISDETFTYDPEYAWNYEIGVKTAFLNNRLRVNASVFYVDITDKQIYVNNPNVSGVPMAPDINNAGKAHTLGAEIGIHANPVQGINLFANLGLLQTEIDTWSYPSKSGIIDFQGNELPYSPDYTASLGGIWRPGNGIFLGADMTAMGSYYGEASNKQKQENVELVNLHAGYEAESFDIIFWCKNVFDREYFTTLDEMPSGFLKVVEGDPRLFGATFTYRL